MPFTLVYTDPYAQDTDQDLSFTAENLQTLEAVIEKLLEPLRPISRAQDRIRHLQNVGAAATQAVADSLNTQLLGLPGVDLKNEWLLQRIAEDLTLLACTIRGME